MKRNALLITCVLTLSFNVVSFTQVKRGSEFVEQKIEAANVKGVRVVVSKKVETDGCNHYELEGEFWSISVDDWLTKYLPYIGNFSISQTKMRCPSGTLAESETLKKDFTFQADESNEVAVAILIPDGYGFSLDEIH